MSEQARVSHPKELLSSSDIEGWDALAELALDMRWSWNHAHRPSVAAARSRAVGAHAQSVGGPADGIAREAPSAIWPMPLSARTSTNRCEARRDAAQSPAWFQQTHPQSALSCVAYFSMEFMLSEALPIYSGGLGNVAGDQLKAASDLGVPRRRRGTALSAGLFSPGDRARTAHSRLSIPYNDPGQLPITPLRKPNGEWLRLEIALPGYSVWLRAWQVQVGRAQAVPAGQQRRGELPGASWHHQRALRRRPGAAPASRRCVLGIGGWRLLRGARASSRKSAT